VKLSPLRPGDAPALADLHARAFETPWDADAIEGALGSPGAFGLAAWDGEAPAGFILARAIAGEAEILTLAVDPDLRRRGIGRALLAASLALGAHGGASAAFLEVEVGNEAAIGLYERAGFALAGRRRAYYANGHDALVYRLDLNSRDAAAYP
jgi:ribosomal-protein-alanine N-acetyltransferase